jgi:hypothetical protein
MPYVKACLSVCELVSAPKSLENYFLNSILHIFTIHYLSVPIFSCIGPYQSLLYKAINERFIYYRVSERSGTSGNFNYFSYFYLKVKVKG